MTKPRHRMTDPQPDIPRVAPDGEISTDPQPDIPGGGPKLRDLRKLDFAPLKPAEF